jgi:hypothetical protein
MRGQHRLDRGLVRSQVDAVQPGVRVGGRQPGGVQQLVGLAQPDTQGVGQPQHHLPARPGPAGFQERDVPAGGADPPGQGELAQTAVLAPLP